MGLGDGGEGREQLGGGEHHGGEVYEGGCLEDSGEDEEVEVEGEAKAKVKASRRSGPPSRPSRIGKVRTIGDKDEVIMGKWGKQYII